MQTNIGFCLTLKRYILSLFTNVEVEIVSKFESFSNHVDVSVKRRKNCDLIKKLNFCTPRKQLINFKFSNVNFVLNYGILLWLL